MSGSTYLVIRCNLYIRIYTDTLATYNLNEISTISKSKDYM